MADSALTLEQRIDAIEAKTACADLVHGYARLIRSDPSSNPLHAQAKRKPAHDPHLIRRHPRISKDAAPFFRAE